MKVLCLLLMSALVFSSSEYALGTEAHHVSRGEDGVPIDVCFDRRLLGTWRRYGDHVNQQLTYFPDGWVSGFTDNDPTKPDGFGNGDTTDEGVPIGGDHKDCTAQQFNETGEFCGGRLVVDKDGLRLSILSLDRSDAKPVRFRKIIPLPTIDWTKTAHDGGYLWDFRHRCTSDIPRRITIRGFVNDYYFFATDVEPPHQAFAADSDGTLWWSFNEHDPLLKRDYCQPDDHTLIVAQPGPRGVLLPHVYEVYPQRALRNRPPRCTSK